MRLAFYAPMKPPDDPVPSGDRTIARNLMAALRHLGANVELASTFRSRDGRGNPQAQQELITSAAEEIAALVKRGTEAGWQAWISYHNYYKAPDLLGPAVTAALGIPYLQVESTRAKKRLTGPWASFAHLAEAATDAARAVFHFTDRDAEALRRDAPAGQSLIPLKPFLLQAAPRRAAPSTGRILSAGMMRNGDKFASYQIIAETLALLPDRDWHLAIAGDGPARPGVAALMAPFGNRVRFLGRLDAPDMAQTFAASDILLWPGVNEALGMVFLEAQAAGLAVVAQDRPGMRELLAPAAYPAVAAGPEGLAAMLQAYLDDPARCAAAGQAAQDHVSAHHLLDQAAQTLARGLAIAGVAA